MSDHDQSTRVREIPIEQERRDLIRSTACLWIWGIPIALAVITEGLHEAGAVPSVVTGIGWMIVTCWIGSACFVNGRRCGRVHCRIDGIALPLLGLVALAKMLGFVSFSWSVYNDIFWIVSLVSFVPEVFGWKYSRTRGR